MEAIRERCIYDELLGENYQDGDEINYDPWFEYMISMRQIVDSKEALSKDASDQILKRLKNRDGSRFYNSGRKIRVEQCEEFAVMESTYSKNLENDKYW